MYKIYDANDNAIIVNSLKEVRNLVKADVRRVFYNKVSQINSFKIINYNIER